MEDEDLLDLDDLTELLNADDLEVPTGPAPEQQQDDLQMELAAMREKVKVLEEQLQKKNKNANVNEVQTQRNNNSEKLNESLLSDWKCANITPPVCTKKSEQIVPPKRKLELVKDDIFAKCNSSPKKESPKRPSLVHHGDTDSSDDEEKRNNVQSSLNEFGRTIKNKLSEYKHQFNTSGREFNKSAESERRNWKSSFQAQAALVKNSTKAPGTIDNSETDPYSGLRILNPLVSSQALRERMVGRKMIKLSLIQNHIRYGDIEGDWVTIAVIVHKGEPKTSKNGKTFSIWKLNDLQNLDNFVSLFLFGNVHKDLWKTSTGTVIGLLNSKIMPNREGDKTGTVCLTVDHPGKVMIIGQSKDFGTCKGKRKDGAPCHNLVNKKECEFCAYHVQREYKKASRRTELQSSFSGVEPKRFGNQGIKSKILSKNGVMYGGQLYTVPLGRPEKEKHKLKDQLTLTSLKMKQKAKELEDSTRNAVAVKHLTEKENKAVSGVMSSSEFLGGMLTVPTAGSRNLLKHLVKDDTEVNVKQGIIKSVTPRELLDMHKKTFESLKRKRCQMDSSPSPSRQLKLSSSVGSSGPELDLELVDGTSTGTIDVAKVRALALLAKQPVEKKDPNSVKKKKQVSPEQSERILKRVEQNHPSSDPTQLVVEKEPSGGEKPKTQQSRLGEISREAVERIMKMKSSHSYEVDQEEALRVNVYFKNLEKKEQLENKMQTITEISVTVVSCKICKYTSQHPSEMCAKENHLLKRHKALKRFFKCAQCKHRTFAFTKLPTKACRSCGCENFEKTAMMKPKQGPKLDSEELLIRGEEIKFIK